MKLLREKVWLRYLCIPFLMLSLMMVTGCSGCSDDEDATAEVDEEEDEEDKKKKKERKPDYESLVPVLLPAHFPKPKDPGEEDIEKIEDEKKRKNAVAKLRARDAALRANRTKLGHWVTSSFLVRANNFNADGVMTTSSVTAQFLPVPIASTDYYITGQRPFSLAKGEWKNFESSLYLPRRDGKIANATVRYDMYRGAGGLSMITRSEPTILMKPHQYHMVVLSSRPDKFRYIELMDVVQIPEQSASGTKFPEFYSIVKSQKDQPLPLPRESLNWTTTAYIVWDDLDPTLLDTDQQNALVDWLHFGGQLIISSPGCLDQLQTSFLAPYLPAQYESSENLTNEDFAELNENWTVPVKKNAKERRDIVINEKTPILGVRFTPHQTSEFVQGTGKLAIERRIGRGRVVATAFSLENPAIRRWRSYSSFFNGALLRRPAREFGRTRSTALSFKWKNDSAGIFDPLVGSTLRYISRDLSATGTPPGHVRDKSAPTQDPSFYGYSSSATVDQEFMLSSQGSFARNGDDHWHYGGYTDTSWSGTAGWNDKSAISSAARDTLKEAAGISPPSSKFVLRMLAMYLAVLVPLNWIIFRLMGRVEWAWIAAPLIAIAGAFSVVKMASLDIGFVRSNTQIALLELHGDYPRGHLTEYSALYTSLSTSYNIDLDNSSSQSLPFAKVERDGFKKAGIRQGLSEVLLARSRRSRLENFLIQSNSTGLVHSETILETEGPIQLLKNDEGNQLLKNGSNLNLTNVGLIGRNEDGSHRKMWIGDLAAGASVPVKFEPVAADQLTSDWTSKPAFYSNTRAASVLWEKYAYEGYDAAGTKTLIMTLDELRNIPELSEQIDSFESAFRGRYSKQLEANPQHPVSEDDFVAIFRAINAQGNVKVGPIFDATNQLTLANGESRLIGTTDQSLGRTSFSPKATQVDQQTLVLVHLETGSFPLAERDTNSLADFPDRLSSLEWDDEAQEDFSDVLDDEDEE